MNTPNDWAKRIIAGSPPGAPRLRLAEQWQSFERMVLHSPLIGDAQRSDLRDAFYAGARGIFTLMNDAVGDGEETTEKEVAVMAGLDAELEAYGAFVMARAEAARGARREG